jgi:hypothetical protein
MHFKNQLNRCGLIIIIIIIIIMLADRKVVQKEAEKKLKYNNKIIKLNT